MNLESSLSDDTSRHGDSCHQHWQEEQQHSQTPNINNSNNNCSPVHSAPIHHQRRRRKRPSTRCERSRANPTGRCHVYTNDVYSLHPFWILAVFYLSNSFQTITTVHAFGIPSLFPRVKTTSGASTSMPVFPLTDEDSVGTPTSSATTSHAHSHTMKKKSKKWRIQLGSSPEDDDDDTTTTTRGSARHSVFPSPLLDWRASGSIGSLLMQMELREEQLRHLNQTLGEEHQALELSPMHQHHKTSTTTPSAVDTLFKDASSSRQKESKDTSKASSKKEDSWKGETRDLAGVDMDDPEEWKAYCTKVYQNVRPLTKRIRQGAEAIRGTSTTKTNPTTTTSTQDEELFLAAWNACRSLADSCTISEELSTLITDEILQVHTEGSSDDSESSLIDDLVQLLEYAHEMDRPKSLFAIRKKNRPSALKLRFSKNRREARHQCKLYVLQLLLALVNSSDNAVDALRTTDGLREIVYRCSSFVTKEQRRRWLRYPREVVRSLLEQRRQPKSQDAIGEEVPPRRQPFIEAAALKDNTKGQIQGAANKLLAAIGYNQWVPKMPGQKGLRILCLDGGGSRGMTSVMAVNSMVESLGVEIADSFDFVVGTSTGAIIAFLIGLRRETSKKAVERYDVLIPAIFAKSALDTPRMLFTTATYNESPFMTVLGDILGDHSMLDSRADPSVPYVFAVTSKMSSTPTHVALFRNYNYDGGEKPDPFVMKPAEAREALDLNNDVEEQREQRRRRRRRKSRRQKRKEAAKARSNASGAVPWKNAEEGSRHPGSFRVLQKYALRASTAAPTVFKPVLMGGEMYCDGGIVASNPTAIGIHEARSVFPDVPIELVVSIGTGGFLEQKSAPKVGWSGIISQIVDSACDGEQIHHILEDILGDGGARVQPGSASVSGTRYMRFNPILGLPDDFPIDITDPEKLDTIKNITTTYMKEPEQQRKLQELSGILKGRTRFRKWLRR